MNAHVLEAATVGHVDPTAERPKPNGSFVINIDNDNVAWVTFDTPGSAANVWNDATLREFSGVIDVVLANPDLRGFVLRSGKDKIMIAGADLKAVHGLTPQQLEDFIDLGQKVFNRLAALPLPKVALIHGACVGGGFETALACDIRIASDSPSTRIGLPETQMGLVPAWGGSTRLPRLIGLQAALEAIVSGKLYKPSAARRLGLVDAVVPSEHLEAEARKWLKVPLPKRKLSLSQSVWQLPGLAKALATLVRKQVLDKTRGLYPAPLRAVDVVPRAASVPLEQAMEAERHAILDLARTPEAGNIIDIFFRKEEAAKKPYRRSGADDAAGKMTTVPIHRAIVVGAGVMGSGIAHLLASRGCQVLLQDISSDFLARGLGRIQDLLQDGLKHRAISKLEMRQTLDLITPTHQPVPVRHFPLIIEAATEDMAVKKKIFAALAERTGPDTILATNTSALSVTELAQSLPKPERVIGIHFFNPVHRMPLVEVVKTRYNTEEVIATAVAFVQSLGKVPVVVSDSPGFIVNRILMPYLMEAVRLHETGISAELIDEAMLDFGMPMGPMRLLDEVGLDVAAHVAKTLAAAYPDRLAPTSTLERMMAAGKLGRKSGGGFYQYPTPKAKKPERKPEDETAIEAVSQRLALLMSNEASRCAAEGITSDSAHIDLAMVLGSGYPPFRGGPLAWLRGFGIERATVELEALAASTPKPNPFTPAVA